MECAKRRGIKAEKVSIVMPALNEEEGIAKTIKSVPRTQLENNGYKVEIIVVDGGSTDDTIALAKKAGARVILCSKGYGRQYKEGFKAASGSVIITGDSDCAYPFEDSLKYLNHLKKHKLDFITINRFAELEPGAMSFLNRIGNWGLTFAANILFGFSLQDSQSGMWIIRRNILDYLNINSRGMPFSQEIKIEAFRKVKSAEVDGRYKIRFGETKLARFNDGFWNLIALFKKRMEM